MKTKSLKLFLMGVLALVLVASFASAATIASDNFDDGDLNGWTVTGWTNTGTYAESTAVAGASLERTFSASGFNTLVVKYDRQLVGDWEATDLFNASWSIDGTSFTSLEQVTGVDGADGLPGDSSFVSKTFNLPASADNKNFILKFECTTNAASEFCRVDNVLIEGTAVQTEPSEITSCDAVGNPGELKVGKIDFTNNGMSQKEFGKDDEWFPFEEVEVQIEVDNDGNDDVDDVEVSWGLWNTKSNEWVIDFDEEDEVNIKDGDTEKIMVSFVIDDDLDVDLEDLDDGENYRLYVTARGVVDNANSDDTCVSDFETASIIIESDFVVLDNLNVPEIVQCGANVEVTADVWNIGDKDQDEVSVGLLGPSGWNVNKIVDVGDIDAFDNQKLSFNFIVPEDADEGAYFLRLQVYDEDQDIYENDFDDDPSEFSVPLRIENCAPVGPEVGITAGLESQAKAGEELVIKVLLTNMGTASKTYVVDVSGYESWAQVTELPQTLTINPGSVQEALIKFDVDRGVEGQQSFTISVLSGTEVVATQPVSVNIEPRSLFGFTGAAISGNTYLWGLGLLNIILVIIIIIVAIRIARK